MRVSDMRGVDLLRTSFDFDLTFAALLMHPDGHVYHRYGARDERAADDWLSLESWRGVLEETLAEHASYKAQPLPSARKPRKTLETIPAFAKRDKGECIHCHSVYPALYETARAAGTWTEDDRWVHPPPGRIGLDLDRDEQTLVVAVTPASVAARAGIEVGDRLLQAGSQRLTTVSDLSQVLHDLTGAAVALEVKYARDETQRSVTFDLPAGWKRGTPFEFSWRPFKWGFTPAPGFGGALLDAPSKRALGLAAGTFAFRIDYFVTWGENRRYGREAGRAGLRAGDVFLAAGGKSDFASVDHFHAWWRLTQHADTLIEVEFLRAGKRATVELSVLR